MRKIVVLVPGGMPKRVFCETPVFSHFLQQKNIDLMILSTSSGDKTLFESKGVKWRNLYSPIKPSKSVGYFALKIGYAIQIRLLALLNISHGSLAFRFNHLQQFKSHLFKIRMPVERKARELLAGNYVDEKLGFPFPTSKGIYRFLYRVLYGRWILPDPNVYTFFKENKPDAVVFLFSQNVLLQSWYLAAKKFHCKTISVTGSWDRLTTKGHLFPQFDQYIVNSQKMRMELETYHGVEQTKIVNVGWPQMDHFFAKPVTTRAQFCQQHGLPLDNKIILFTANSERFGKSEPAVLDHIRQKMKDNTYTKPVTLLIRPHPNDQQWRTRLSPDNAHVENELLMKAEHGNIQLLGDLLKFVDMVISTQGSISLDAIAMDVPVINLSFDCVEVSESESIKRLYEMDHYHSIATSGAVQIVNNLEELDEAINGYINDAKKDATARKLLREKEVEPFDGKASERLVSAIMQVVGN